MAKMFVKKLVYKTGSMAKMMISCKEATEFILKKEEQKLRFKEQLQLWMHIGICGLCKLFMKQSKIISRSASHIHDHSNASLTDADKKIMIEKLEKKSSY